VDRDAPATGPARRAIVVHGIAHGRAALAASLQVGAAVTMLSAPGAAAAAGVGWFEALVRQLRREFPEASWTAVLDCADRADLVQAAFRQGLGEVCYRGAAETAERLADLAGQYGGRLHRARGEALELEGAADPRAACLAWLGAAPPH